MTLNDSVITHKMCFLILQLFVGFFIHFQNIKVNYHFWRSGSKKVVKFSHFLGQNFRHLTEVLWTYDPSTSYPI